MSRLHRKRSVVMQIVGTGSVSVALAVAHPALLAVADQSPSNCNSNRFNISIIKDHTEVYQGEVLTYTVTASNVNLNTDLACDITNATIDVTLPAADGTATGTVVNLVTGQDYLAGTSTTVVGSAQYVVNVNAGVTDVVAQAGASGTLHDAPVNHSALIIKTLGTTVVAAPTTPGGGTSTTNTPVGVSASHPKLPNTGTAPRP